MRVLLAEDDDILADALASPLSNAGFRTDVASDGQTALSQLLDQSFDLAVLDLGLPLMDGLTVLKRVRAVKPALPILILTAMDGLEHRVSGLNAGADDYLTKPFDFPELEARLRALLRRSKSATGATDLGRMIYDREARRVSVMGEVLELSPREWLLLDLLLTHRDRVVTKEQIHLCWSADGSEAVSGNNAVEVYIHRLRRKIDNSGVAIRTVRGLGYLLELDTQTA